MNPEIGNPSASEKMRQNSIDENMRRAKEHYTTARNTPTRRFRMRFEMFKITVCVGLPVLTVWFFNSPRFQDLVKGWLDENYNPSTISKEQQRMLGEETKKLNQELKQRRQEKEYADFLREQMEFERAKKERERLGI